MDSCDLATVEPSNWGGIKARGDVGWGDGAPYVRIYIYIFIYTNNANNNIYYIYIYIYVP